MGVMRFLVPSRDWVAQDAVDRAYMTGLEEVPWQSRTEWTDEGLTIRRNENDSGNFHIPWVVSGHGELMLTTASLMQRDKTYHLPVELARGTLNRLRNQIAAWQQVGLQLPQHVVRHLVSATEYFSRAATAQHEPARAAEQAELSISAGMDAMALLAAAYADQALASRRRQNARLGTLLGINLGAAPLTAEALNAVHDSFNTAVVPLTWRDIEPVEGKPDWSLADKQIEWCRANNMRVCAGPLLQLDKRSIPNWLYLYEDDEDTLLRSILEHIKATVARYQGKVQLWQCVGRGNTGDAIELGEEQRLRLAVMVVEAIRGIDARTPLIVGIDQPWGEFMGREECDLSPIHFADALVRADIGIAGLGLEINLCRAVGGTQPRDLLDLGAQLDRWSCLGLPLVISLTYPSSDEPDPEAKVTIPASGNPGNSPDHQRRWVEQALPLMLAKQPVQCIIWNQATDGQPHEFPHAGLFDAKGKAKPALAAIKAIRKQVLG